MTVCEGRGGLSLRDVTLIKIHCRGDSVFNCYNCYCGGAATLCEQAHKYGPLRGSIILIGLLNSTGP